MHLAQAFNQRACVLILLEVLHAGKKIIMASMHDEIHFYEFNYRVTCSHLKKKRAHDHDPMATLGKRCRQPSSKLRETLEEINRLDENS